MCLSMASVHGCRPCCCRWQLQHCKPALCCCRSCTACMHACVIDVHAGPQDLPWHITRNYDQNPDLLQSKHLVMHSKIFLFLLPCHAMQACTLRDRRERERRFRALSVSVRALYRHAEVWAGQERLHICSGSLHHKWKRNLIESRQVLQFQCNISSQNASLKAAKQRSHTSSG